MKKISKTNTIGFLVLLFISTSSFAQQNEKLIDTRDGQEYSTVRIGNQVWMAENLNYNDATSSQTEVNNNNFGRTYTFKVAKEVCPTGWHLPSKADFRTLFKLYGKKGTEVYEAIKENGISGFNASLGGFKVNEMYGMRGKKGFFWAYNYNQQMVKQSYCMEVDSKSKKAKLSIWDTNEIEYKDIKFSVRCLKD